MLRLLLLFVLHTFVAKGTVAILTTPPLKTSLYGWNDGDEGSSSQCKNGFPGSLILGPMTTFDFKPSPKQQNGTAFLWSSYGKARPQLSIKVCDYTFIAGVSFGTSNVKSAGIIVDGEPYYGSVDQNGRVEVTTSSATWSSFKAGWEIRINVTPKKYQEPVLVKDLDIKICSVYYDCFDDCAVYVLDPSTGCKKPKCRSPDPCDELYCNDDQECRLIEEKDYSTFPSFMTPAAQLWGCVDKSRTDYGCVCKEYGIGDDKCPTCNCQSGTTTAAT